MLCPFYEKSDRKMMVILLSLAFLFCVYSLDLYPLRTGIGRFVGQQTQYDSVFLARKEIEVIETDDSSLIICDVIPILLKDHKEVSLVTHTLKNDIDVSINDVLLIINKDHSLYDNLPYAWDKNDKNSSKKRLNDYFMNNIKRKIDTKLAANAMGYFLYGVEVNLGCSVTSLFLEIKDEYDDAVELGGAALFQRKKQMNTLHDKTITNIISTDENVNDYDNCLVFTSLGELFSIAISTGIPISIKKDLFLASSVDAQLDNQKIIATTNKESIKCTDSSLVAAWDIYDCEKFISMTTLEKRAVLRASGVVPPRSTLGEMALNIALVDVMDDAVRAEYLQKVNNKGNKSYSDTSQRQSLLREMAAALESGNIKLAEELREQFKSQTIILADNTQRRGAYDKYLDQDEWYFQQRQKAMKPKSK